MPRVMGGAGSATCWLTGYARRRIEGELQALRNSHGPSWLVRFSFKHYDEQSARK
jgi:hypothetical protein